MSAPPRGEEADKNVRPTRRCWLDAEGCAEILLGGGDGFLDGGFDVFAGECGGGGAEDQGDGDGLGALVERFAAVGGDEFEVFEIRKIEGADEAFDLFVGSGFGDDQGEIAADGGEAGERMELGDVLGEFEEGFQFQFGGHDLLAEGELVGDGAIDAADVADGFGSPLNGAGGGRGEAWACRRVRGHGTHTHTCAGLGLGDDVEGTLGIELIEESFDCAAGGAVVFAADEGDAAALVDFAIFVEPESGADFEEFGAGGAVGFVVADGLEEAGDDAGAEAGIGGADVLVSAEERGGLRGAEIVGQEIGDEGEGERFEIAGGDEGFADGINGGFIGRLGGEADGDLIAEGDFVVADDAGDFFDEVNFDVEVEAMGGDLHFDGFAFLRGGELEASEGVEDLGRGKIGAEELAEAGEAEGEFFGVIIRRAGGDEAGKQFAAGGLENELGSAEAGAFGEGGIDLALESIGGVGFHGQGTGGFADGEGIEAGGFEEDVGGGIGDFGVSAAHDAGEGDGASGVGDDEHAGAEEAFAAVDAGDFFGGAGFADDDFVAGELVEVEGVEGLAEFEHDVVGDIDDIVDGAQTDGFEAFDHPVGAFGDFDVAENAGGVEGAEILRFDLDGGGGTGGSA